MGDTLTVELRVLRSIDLTGPDGKPASRVLRQPKRLGLLTYLAVARPTGFHRRDTLLALFWPELDEQHGRAALRKSLHLLRQDLGADLIVSRGDEQIALAEDLLWCDALAFRCALEDGRPGDAFDLYRGGFLQGFHIDGASSELEHWIDTERTQFRRGAADAAWRLSATAEEDVDLTAAADWARRAFELAPPDDAGLRRLLALLDRAGDRAGALRAYHKYATWLADEYGAEPAPETIGVIQAIKARTEASAELIDDVLARPEPKTATQAEISDTPVARRPRSPWYLSRALIVAAFLIAVSLLPAILALWPSNLVEDRVVVMPFENRTGRPDLDDVGTMAADWIGRGLDEVGLAEVVPRSLVPPGAADPVRLARSLGAAKIISGSFYLKGDSVVFSADLIDVARSRMIRSFGTTGAPMQRATLGVDDLRGRVMGGLAAILDASYRTKDLTSTPPSYEAYRAFVQAEEASSRRQWNESLRLYYLAASLDTSYTLPLVRAAVDHFNAGQCSLTDSLASVLKHRRESMSDYEVNYLDRSVAWCHGDWNAAYRSARGIAEAAPKSALAQYLFARSALFINRPGEAVESLEAIARDRELIAGYAFHRDLSVGYHMLSDHRREIEVANEAHEAFPDLIEPLQLQIRAAAALGQVELVNEYLEVALAMTPPSTANVFEAMRVASDELRAHGHKSASLEVAEQLVTWLQSRAATSDPALTIMTARALYRAERFDEASQVVDVLVAQVPDEWRFRAEQGRIAARSGDVDLAERISAELAALDHPYLRGGPTYARAQIAAVLGRRDEAVALLRDAIAEGRVFSWSAGIFDDEPDFESLHGYEPYEAVLRPRG